MALAYHVIGELVVVSTICSSKTYSLWGDGERPSQLGMGRQRSTVC